MQLICLGESEIIIVIIKKTIKEKVSCEYARGINVCGDQVKRAL